MIRRALFIIANHGTSQNYLPGVDADFQNYLNFFKSDEGGAWEDNEIHVGFDWTQNALDIQISLCKALNTVYFLTVFVEHGYAIENDDTYFELSKDEIISLGWIKKKLFSQKALIIADSCRCYIQLIEKAQVLAQGHFSDSKKLKAPRAVYRDLYDKHINLNLEWGHFTFASSTSLDEAANDTDDGGLYSKTLLQQAKSIIDKELSGIWQISDLHKPTAEKVAYETLWKQNPTIYSSNSRYTPPFVVIAPYY